MELVARDLSPSPSEGWHPPPCAPLYRSCGQECEAGFALMLTCLFQILWSAVTPSRMVMGSASFTCTELNVHQAAHMLVLSCGTLPLHHALYLL